VVDDIVTDATGASIVRSTLPLLPSLVAVMVTDPGATAVTSPDPFTVARADDEVDHAICRPLSALPEASFVVAVSCVVCDGASFETVELTLTEATGVTPGLVVPPLSLPPPPQATENMTRVIDAICDVRMMRFIGSPVP
jgi:hypothetical protein